MKLLMAAALAALTLSGCSLVYRIDIPQGNYVEQKQVDKLRQGMTREQVVYVLGSPMLKDAFDHDTWHYLYEFQPGRGDKERKEMTLKFVGDRLATMTGDFTVPATFNTPL
ncbi:Small protein A [Aeromonas diversa CDC 2478-85]|uniref:Outer membrane protein assembly factor BamE n=2 Tax=Aeromonas diversa TaxID=502790 RepID=N9TYB7_9GAMM|nr:Small protein A [Aeromonas diversa CDC 2478-85]